MSNGSLDEMIILWQQANESRQLLLEARQSDLAAMKVGEMIGIGKCIALRMGAAYNVVADSLREGLLAPDITVESVVMPLPLTPQPVVEGELVEDDWQPIIFHKPSLSEDAFVEATTES